MSKEDLQHLLEEIERRQNSDARACLNLLQLIDNTRQPLPILEETQAEKKIRRLISVPIKIPITQEKQEVKKRCRELISKWGMQRREQKMQEERKQAGSTSSLAMLMRRAQESLVEKKERQQYAFSRMIKSSSDSI